MTDAEQLAWAGGLFEGEGTFAISNEEGRAYLRARLSSTDEDVVRRFHDIVGYGNVTGPYQPKKAHWKPFWAWYATGDAVVCLFALIEPWLGKRRKARFQELCEIRAARLASKPGQIGLFPRKLSLTERMRLIAEYLERVEDYYRAEQAAA